MWQSAIRAIKRVVRPIVPRPLLEIRRRRIRRRAAPTYAAIDARLSPMLAASSADVLGGVDVAVTAAARRVLAAIPGRFEDVRFSPNGRRLALVAFQANVIVILSVEIRSDRGLERVAIDYESSVTSSHIQLPHGVAFIDDDTIVLASRAGGVAIFGLPDGSGTEAPLAPLRLLRGGRSRVRYAPGSVEVEQRGDQVRVFVCDNDSEVVTVHAMSRDGKQTEAERVLIGRDLQLPDGIAISNDGRWIAVSCHSSGNVQIFSNTTALGPETAPAGTLRGIACPHGVRFLNSGRGLIVADAAGPWVHVYTAADGNWEGERQPVRTVRTMDDASWRRGHVNPSEGGPKGITVDPGDRVLVTTCEEQVLGVFSLSQVLAGSEAQVWPGLAGHVPPRHDAVPQARGVLSGQGHGGGE